MKKTALLVMIITIVSKILGFGREIVLSYVYGASAITDAYLVSQTIPAVIFGFVSAGVATSFIPLYSRIFNEQGQLEANRYTNNLSNALLLLSSIMVSIVFLFTQPIVKIFASGFSTRVVPSVRPEGGLAPQFLASGEHGTNPKKNTINLNHKAITFRNQNPTD